MNCKIAAAVWRGEGAVATLVEQGRGLDARLAGGLTLLHWATARGFSPKLVGRLLDAGLDPNARSVSGLVPLALVASKLGDEVVLAYVGLFVRRRVDFSPRMRTCALIGQLLCVLTREAQLTLVRAYGGAMREDVSQDDFAQAAYEVIADESHRATLQRIFEGGGPLCAFLGARQGVASRLLQADGDHAVMRRVVAFLLP